MEGTCKHASICGRDARDEYDGCCILHAEAAKKDGTEFRRELEAHWKEHGADFRKMKFPVEIDFSNSTFRTAVDFSGATFQRSADFKKAVFEETVSFQGANFGEGAQFSGVAFEKEADFSDAKLQEADFSNTDLSRADLSGADLTGAELPDDATQSEALVRVGEASQYARSLFFILLTACLYSWLAIGTTSDPDLFSNTATTPLPFIGATISIVGFYWVAPLALFVLYVYFHLQLQRLWEEVSRLPALFPDGQPLDKKTDPWLLLGLTRTHATHLNEDRLPFFWLQRGIAHLVAWWTVPLTLVLFWLRYLPRPDPYGTSLHLLLIVVATGLATSFYHKAVTTLRADGARPFHWGKALKDERVALPVVFICLIVAPLFGVANWSGVTKPDLRQADLEGVDLTGEYLFDPHLRNGKFGEADLSRSDLSGAKLHGATLLNAELDSAELDSAKLKGANLSGASLESAELDSAKLHYADLSGVDLDSTDLSSAVLSKTPSLTKAKNIDKARFSRARLRELDLAGVVLQGATLRNAKLDSASLIGADLSNADLKNAELDSANLTGSELASANLAQTDLSYADLHKASLADTANLSGAELTGADLREANLSNAILFRANLDSAKLSGAKLSGADLTDASVKVDSLCRVATLQESGMSKKTVSSICDRCPEKFEDPGRCGQ